ncbi:MAG: CGNR zinc finger domain-containing protein [Microbacterium sp.]
MRPNSTIPQNRSTRYCDEGNCGNRMSVNAYRRWQAEQETP